jgi:hypothetical protein
MRLCLTRCGVVGRKGKCGRRAGGGEEGAVERGCRAHDAGLLRHTLGDGSVRGQSGDQLGDCGRGKPVDRRAAAWELVEGVVVGEASTLCVVMEAA